MCRRGASPVTRWCDCPHSSGPMSDQLSCTHVACTCYAFSSDQVCLAHMLHAQSADSRIVLHTCCVHMSRHQSRNVLHSSCVHTSNVSQITAHSGALVFHTPALGEYTKPYAYSPTLQCYAHPMYGTIMTCILGYAFASRSFAPLAKGGSVV